MDELIKEEMLEHYIAINMVNKMIDRYGVYLCKDMDDFMDNYYKLYNRALNIIRETKKIDVELNSYDIDKMFQENDKVDLDNPIFDK